MENNVNTAPALQLKTNRSFLKIFLLSLITLGIYALVQYNGIADDVNTVCSKYDGKKTTNYILMSFILAPLTLGIYGLVWFHKISNRIGDELKRRGIDYKFGAGSFWLWNTLGLLLFGLGPIIYTVKYIKAVNLLNADYNVKG